MTMNDWEWRRVEGRLVATDEGKWVIYVEYFFGEALSGIAGGFAWYLECKRMLEWVIRLFSWVLEVRVEVRLVFYQN